MKAYLVYQEASGQEYDEIDNLGYFLSLDRARAFAAQMAAKENREALKGLRPDGRMYLDTTLFEEQAPGWWARKNHMGDNEHIRVAEITIEE